MTTDIDDMAKAAIAILNEMRESAGLTQRAKIDEVVGYIRDIDNDRQTAWEEAMGEDL